MECALSAYTDPAPLGEHLDDELRAFSPPATRKSLSSSDASDAQGTCPPLQAPPTLSATPATGDDCGACSACVDKPKFGGPGIKRKGCLAKRASMEPRATVGLLDSVLRPPVLTTPPDAYSGSSGALGRRARSSSLSHGASAASLASKPPLTDAHGKLEREECVDSPPLRKDYALRKRGAAAGEQIMMEHARRGADDEGDELFALCQDVDDDADAPSAGRGGLSHKKPKGSPRGGSRLGVPSTPMLKTPELAEAAAGASLGMSPLSEFASLLHMTPRLPEQGGLPDTSPLFQLASLMEKTPRMDVAHGKKDGAAEPEELSKALLASVETPSPGEGTTGQLRRDLSRALLQATSLSSPGARGQMLPPPPRGGEDTLRHRKRKLEGELGEGEGGMFDMVGHVVLGDERLMISELLDPDSLELKPPPGRAKHRSKGKEKEKGKPSRCRCDRSGCLKRYCVCFAAGNACSPSCKCKGCHNDDTTDDRKATREQAILDMQKKKANAFNPRVDGEGDAKVHLSGCNCKKSACRKRYCECFQAGVKCTEKCKCCVCHNPAGANPHAGLGCADDAALGSELLALTDELPSPSSAELRRQTPTMSPVGSSPGGLRTFASLGRPSAARGSPFTSLLHSPAVASPALDGLAAAAAAAEGHAEAHSEEEAEMPGSPEPMRAAASVEMMPSPDAGLILPQAKAAPAADTPEPCVGEASRGGGTPSPPALGGGEWRVARGLHAKG